MAGAAQRAPAKVPGAETLQEAAGRAGRLAGLAGGTARDAADTAGQLYGRAAGATREAAGAAGETARAGTGERQQRILLMCSMLGLVVGFTGRWCASVLFGCWAMVCSRPH